MSFGNVLGDYPFPSGDRSPHPPNAWFPGPTRVHVPNGSSIGSAALAQLMVVYVQQTHADPHADTQTTRIVGNNRPHPSAACMRCELTRVQLRIVTYYRPKQWTTDGPRDALCQLKPCEMYALYLRQPGHQTGARRRRKCTRQPPSSL